MATINDILKSLEGQDTQVKTASSKNASQTEVEKQAQALGLIKNESQTKTASLNGGRMNLKDLYDAEMDSMAKTAAEAETSESEEEESEEEGEKTSSLAMGELAGVAFNQALNVKLASFIVKLAEDALPDAEVSQEIQSGEGVIPSAEVGNPQLPVEKNRQGQADAEPIDTTPVHFDLNSMQGAVAQVELEDMLGIGNVDAVANKTVSVDTGLEMPETQKTASLNMRDLTRDQFELLNYQYPVEMKKQAQLIYIEETQKLEKLASMAQEFYAYGADLAMAKIAEMEEKAKEESKEKSEESESEAEKTSSAAGLYIAEGFWNTLMEKGAEFYGDKNVYLEEFTKEAMGMEGAKKAIKSFGSAVKNKASKAYGYSKDKISKGYNAAKGDVEKFKKSFHKIDSEGSKRSLGTKLKDAEKTTTGKALAVAGIAGATYGGDRGYKALTGKKDNNKK